MMLFAPIAPVSMCDIVTSTSGYLMALPSMVDVDLEYAQLHRSLTTNGAFVMLDNGVSEYKAPLSLLRLSRYIELIEPTEIILPDYLGDPEMTVGVARSASRAFSSGGQRRLMGVPQGNNFDEYVACIYEFIGMPFINTIGISKYFPKITGTPRRQLLETVKTAGLHRRRSLDWHLLGLAETVDEVAGLAMDFPWIRGLDTCYPVLASMMGLDIREHRQIVTSPPGFEAATPLAYWPAERDSEELWELLMTNLALFKRACRGREL